MNRRTAGEDQKALCQENTSNERTMDLCQTHSATKEAACLTCFEQICFACAFNSHSEHRTIAMTELDVELRKETKNLRIETASSEDKLEMLRAHIKTQEYYGYEKSEDELQRLTKSAEEQLERQKYQFEALCKATVLSDKSETKRYKKLFEEVETSVNSYREAADTILHKSHLSRLQYLNELTSKIDIEETKLDDCAKYFLKCSIKNQIRPASLSAKVAVLAKGPVIGAIKLHNNQVMMIRNHQDSKNYIHLACLSCKEPNVLCWEKTFEITKDPPLIVVANSLMLQLQGLMILVAFGRKLLVIEMHLDGKMQYIFYKSSSIIELNVPVNSHITGIAPVKGKIGHNEIITTDSISEMFHIFDTNFNLSGKVKCKETSQVLACIKEDGVYKIVATVNFLSATILGGKLKSGEFTRVGKIENTYNSREMFIKCIMFDGAFLSTLWVSRTEFLGDITQWRVVAYDRDGVQFKVSAEGECETDMRPVSISHFKHKTLLCFSDGSIREFCTGGLPETEFPDLEQLNNMLTQEPLHLLKGLTDVLMAALK